MDRTIVDRKLDSLRRCIGRVRERCPDSAEALANDVDAQDILSVNLTRAVQLCVDIAAHLVATLDSPPPDSMGAAFDVLAHHGLIDDALAGRMRAAVGFRNVASHSYQDIDWRIVFAIATERLVDFEDFARAVPSEGD